MTRRDPRPYIYYALDQLSVAAVAYVLAELIPNRLASAALHLWAIPAAMQVMAISTLWRRPLGRKLALAAGTLVLALATLLVVRIVVSAAFLAGVYGAFGQAAAVLVLVGAALVIELVALLPIVQVKYLMSRAGRRAYGA
ncbi:MAG TPA: hypothetical protein VGF94_15295 [Kofleriaceae bacterium]